MSSQTSDRIKFQTDRQYYAELWGTNHHAVRRDRWAMLRSRSSVLAVAAGALLIGQLTLNALLGSGQPPEVVLGSGAGRSFDEPMRAQRVSSVFGLVDEAGDIVRVESQVDADLWYPDRAIDPRLRFE